MSSSQTAEAIARRLGVPEPTEDLLDLIQSVLADAEDDVVGYLGQPIRPVTKTARQCWPVAGGWSITGEHGTIRDILTTTPETVDGMETGTFTITYTVGLDYDNDPQCGPIRRYIRAAVMNDYQLLNYLQTTLHQRGPVSSVSVSTEGQSKTVQFGHLGYTPPASRGSQSQDYPGSLPKLTTLDRWRVANRRIRQAPDLGFDSRLYTATGIAGVPYRDTEGFWNQP